MRNCPSCGKPVAADAAFCGGCGAPVPSNPQPAAPVDAAPAAFCAQCGEKMSAGAGFCPNCGAQVGAQSPASAKKPMSPGQRNKLIGIAAVAAVVLVAVFLAVKILPGMFTSPAKEFISRQQELLADRLLNEMESRLDALGSGRFSTDLTLSGQVKGGMADLINNYLEDTSVLLKVDLDRDALLATADLELMGSPVLSGVLSYDKGQVGFALPELDENYYVMDLSRMVQNFGGMDLDLSTLKLPEISGKEWRSLIQSYLDVAYTVVNEENVEKETVDAVHFIRLRNISGTMAEDTLLNKLEDGFKGAVYTFTPRSEDVEAMLVKLADNLEKDRTLRGLIIELVNPGMFKQALGEELFFQAFGTDDLEGDLDQALLEAAKTLRDNAGDIGDSVEESGLVWTLCMEGDQVRMIRIDVESENSAMVYATSGTEADGMTELFYTMDYGAVGTSIVHEYTKSGSQLQGQVAYSVPSEGEYVVEYAVDESKRSVLGFHYGTYETEVEGLRVGIEVLAGEKGGVDHVIFLRDDSGYYFENTFDRIELTLNATDKGTAKKPSGKTVDISDYSQEELLVLFSDLGRTIEDDLMDNLGALAYAFYG